MWLEIVAVAANGVVWTSKHTQEQLAVYPTQSKNLVIPMLQQCEGSNHTVFIDHRYTSPELFDKLVRCGSYPTGTVMKNRKGLRKVFMRMLWPGEVLNRRRGKLLAIKWKDKRDAGLRVGFALLRWRRASGMPRGNTCLIRCKQYFYLILLAVYWQTRPGASTGCSAIAPLAPTPLLRVALFLWLIIC